MASFVAFLISPLQMSLLSRALGADGFGRWWWTFVALEVATLLGMQSADLFVRRELPSQLHDRAALHRTVGSALAVAGAVGLVLCAVQIGAARALASSQHDLALIPYLRILALQPVIANAVAILAAALQSVNAYGAIAMVRGIMGPLLQVLFLACAWQLELDTTSVLTGLLSVSLVVLFASTLVYMRHFDLRATLASVRAPTRARDAFRFGLPLLFSNALWTAGAKIDLYVLSRYVGPAALGVYAGCLQLASILPNTRTVFDPVVQTRIAALQAKESRVALGDSLQRLSRLCALSLLPFYVGLVTVGEPVLGFLLGHAVPEAAWPLIVLSTGQLLGSIAVAMWLAPMLLPGRALGMLAATTLLWKTLLLLTLAPRLGALGAAIATATGTVLAQQGMALMGSRLLRVRIYSRGLLLVCLVTSLGALLSAGAQRWLRVPDAGLAFVSGTALAGAISVLALGALLKARERAWLLGWLRARLARG